jgi:hypothetical protein
MSALRAFSMPRQAGGKSTPATAPRRRAAAGRWAVLLGLAILGLAGGSAVRLAAANAPAVPRPADASPSEAAVVARIFYGDRARLAELVSRYDVFEFADHEQGFVLARLEATEWAELEGAGFRLERDEALTAALRRPPRPAARQLAGIPGYPCYRTVEETEAALERLAGEHPHLAALVTLGPSWEKTVPGGAAGYDLRALVLTRRDVPGPKPRLFLLGAHHARELTTAETALRFAEELAAGYDTDPEATWLLDFHEIHVVPVANPDGRKLAEQGLWWRKNTCRTNQCTTYPRYGTDLNRNAGFRWGGVGASAEPCSEVYRGPYAFSEPENQALAEYLRALFPPQRASDETSPAPDTASGLVISLHSYSELVLYPWGWTTNPAPNAIALATLGAKFGFFNRYRVQPSIALYATTGSLDDWAYGELGVAAYTFELGTNFFEACESFETVVWPANRLALRYAAKAARAPYLAPAAPEVVDLALTPARVVQGAAVRLTARADATRRYGLKELPPARRVAGARIHVDRPSWLNEAPPLTAGAEDGTFDQPEENLVATLDTAAWPPGRHTVFVEAQNEDGVWGVPAAAFVWVEPFEVAVALGRGGLELRWPSLPGRTFTVLESDRPENGFQELAAGLPDTPPVNTWPLPRLENGTRFYRVRAD